MKIEWMYVYHMISTVVLLLWNLTAAIQQDYKEVLYASACFHEVQKSLTMNCTTGHMVKLNRIFYAYTEDDNTCSYQPGHCTMDLPESESYSCIGRSTCTINLPSGGTGKYIPKCENYGTYAQAEYQCIPDTETTDICGRESNMLTSQSGFISTPNYPYNYPNNQDCKLNIKAPYPDQQIVLYTIDLTLEENGTGCADWFHLFDGHRAATYCGARARVKEMTSLDNWFDLNFYSSNTNNRKGFWLYYQAIPYRELTTSVEQLTLPPHWSHLTTAGDVQNINGEKNHTVSTGSVRILVHPTEGTTTAYRGNVLTVGAIVGVVVSLLLLITVIILVILVCKKKDTSNSNVKVPSSASCNSEAAFLNFGPNCYAQSPQQTTPSSHVQYHQGMNNQPNGSVNSDCRSTVATTKADGMNITGITDYKLDDNYYNNRGRYLEEVI